MAMHILTKKETVLSNNYLIYAGYIYIFDNQINRSEITCTVAVFKGLAGLKEIRRCDLFEHPGSKLGDMVYQSYYTV